MPGSPGFSGGFVGVDVFFVISGYVITQLLLREAPKGARRGLADFYSRRIRRIVPAATATLVVTMRGGRTVARRSNEPAVARGRSLGVTVRRQLPPHLHREQLLRAWHAPLAGHTVLVTGSGGAVLHRLAGRRLFDGPARRSALFTPGPRPSAHRGYRGFRLVVDPPVSRKSRRRLLLAVHQILGTRFGLPARHSGNQPTHSIASGSSAWPRDWAWRFLSWRVPRSNSASVYPGWRAWLPCAATAALIWAGVGGGRTAVSWLLSTRPLGYVGDISYSLYLLHFPLLELAKEAPSWLSSVDWRLLAIGGAVVVRDLLVSPTGEPNSSVTEARYRPGCSGTAPRCVCRRFVDGDDRRWLTEAIASPRCRIRARFPRSPAVSEQASDRDRNQTRGLGLLRSERQFGRPLG